ncbi:hypothetical protein PACTADRAFT_49639 [Pachysolen tannophilus NRRL Y-2460]|uniref:Uncharacterized protein n=1 Tax=Pachysolen tannophilus NRRL Y-2460 TaxID=669874 RepID=A0A1E4TWY0_PACTA|nr:hypothetical protein PACTADRAFT_49639 [Pachysolen tannophilus NRRL Y-2460]
MKFSKATLAATLATFVSLAAADDELTTYSLVISRDGAIFTKVLTATVGVTAAWAAAYATETDAEAYTVGDSAASASFWGDSTATSSSSASTSTSDSTSSITSSAETTSTAETSATASASSSEDLTSYSVVLYKNGNLFTKAVTSTIGVSNPEASEWPSTVLAYTVGDSSASSSFYSALSALEASTSGAASSAYTTSAAAASTVATVSSYEGGATVAKVGIGALAAAAVALLV